MTNGEDRISLDMFANHRTTVKDLDILFESLSRIGSSLAYHNRATRGLSAAEPILVDFR